jgi:hypothetical protein
MITLNVRRIDLKDDCRHSELHKIQFPEYKDKGFYRTHISYSAFFESGKRRNWSELYLYKLDDRYPIVPISEYEIERDSKLPVIEHDNLYHFFDYIRYDRKLKKIIC